MRPDEMRPIYWLKRIVDHWETRPIASELMAHMEWTPEALRQYQQQQFTAMVTHARHRSRFYQKLYADLPSPFQITDLPIVNKTMLLDHFDDVVVDKRLTLQALQQHLATLNRDEYFLGRYRGFASSGTTGRLGYFVFDRREWTTVQANRRRTGSLGRQTTSSLAGKTALILSSRASSVSIRSAWTMGLRLHHQNIFDCSLNIDTLVQQLNHLQPAKLVGYASTITLLAQRQQAGQLSIQPLEILTGAEMLTESMIEDIKAAWSIIPQQTYGMTESPSLGFPCPVHRSDIHICEDLALIENVDSNYNIVSDGTKGDKILITNLYNRSQPLIRYEISDQLQLAPGPCECGVPFRRIQKLYGRTDDRLIVPGIAGTTVSLEPLLLEGAIKHVPQVMQYQIIHHSDALTVRIVTTCHENEQPAMADRLRISLQRLFSNRQAQLPNIAIEFVSELEREPGGKLRLIKSRPTALS